MQVRQFYKQYIQRGGKSRRKLILSIAPDPTLNSIQVRLRGVAGSRDLSPRQDEQGLAAHSWAGRAALRDSCSPIPRTDRETLREWLVGVFR